MTDTDNLDGFTDEEKAALEAMQSDTGAEESAEDQDAPEPVAEDTSEPEGQSAEEVTAEQQEPAKEEEAQKPDQPQMPTGPNPLMRDNRLMKKQIKELEEKLAALSQPAQQQEAPRPDPVTDPEGFARWVDERDQKHSAALDEFKAQQQRAQEQHQRVQSLTQAEAQFRQEAPDYDQATQFMMQQRVGQMMQEGYSEGEIQAQIVQDINAIYDAASQVGMSAPQLAYQRAISMGYQRQEARPAPQQDPAPQPTPQQQDVGQKIQAAAHAQQQTRGANGAGGGGGGLTMKQLAGMSPEELAKLPADQLQKAMGG